MSSYPGAIWSPPTRADTVDDVVASDFNTPAAEIAAIEGELGTNPKGSAASVAARLTAMTAIGADIYRNATSTADTASGTRTLVGFDTTRYSDTGFTATPASGTIAVPTTGLYIVSAHVRLSASFTAGAAVLAVQAGGTDVVRGDQFQSGTGGVSELAASGVCKLTAADVITAQLFTSGSTSLVGNAAGSAMYLRVARL